MERKNDAGVSGRALNARKNVKNVSGMTLNARNSAEDVSGRTLSSSDYRFERNREAGMKRARSCKHRSGDVGELVVYVHPTCPMMSMLQGRIVSSILRCAECDHWEKRNSS